MTTATLGWYRLEPALAFRVLGKPIPQGAVRHFGRGRPSAYTNQRDLLPWREQVQHGAEKALDAIVAVRAEDDRPTFPLTGPVGLVCHFTMSKPTTAPKTKTTYPTQRPDVSKLTRGVEDALVAAGVMKDDSMIVYEVATKNYPNETGDALHVPGVLVQVFQVELTPGTP